MVGDNDAVVSAALPDERCYRINAYWIYLRKRFIKNVERSVARRS